MTRNKIAAYISLMLKLQLQQQHPNYIYLISPSEYSPKTNYQLNIWILLTITTHLITTAHLQVIITAHLITTAHLAGILAGLKLKPAEFSMQFIQLRMLFANILFNL